MKRCSADRVPSVTPDKGVTAWLLLPAPGAGPVWINLHPVSGLAAANGPRPLWTDIQETFPVSLLKDKDFDHT